MWNEPFGLMSAFTLDTYFILFVENIFVCFLMQDFCLWWSILRQFLGKSTSRTQVLLYDRVLGPHWEKINKKRDEKNKQWEKK